MKHKDQSREQLADLDRELMACTNLGDMLTAVQKKYHLEKVNLSVTKKLYATQLVNLLTTLNPELK